MKRFALLFLIFLCGNTFAQDAVYEVPEKIKLRGDSLIFAQFSRTRYEQCIQLDKEKCYYSKRAKYTGNDSIYAYYLVYRFAFPNKKGADFNFRITIDEGKLFPSSNPLPASVCTQEGLNVIDIDKAKAIALKTDSTFATNWKKTQCRIMPDNYNKSVVWSIGYMVDKQRKNSGIATKPELHSVLIDAYSGEVISYRNDKLGLPKPKTKQK